MIEKAESMKMRAIALTDHNTLSGAVEFFERANEKNIHPVIGSQLTIDNSNSVILLVKNQEGYRNLCKIITLGKLRGGHLKFSLSDDDIFKHKNGLILLSGGKKGRITNIIIKRKNKEAGDWILRYKRVFGEDFFIELQYHSPEDKLTLYKLYEIARLYSVPVVATNDVHLIDKSENSIRKVLCAISKNTTLEKVEYDGSEEQYFKSVAEMKQIFKRYPDAIKNSVEIAKRCKFCFSSGKNIFPVLNLPDGETPYSLLYKKCFEGLKRKYNPIPEKAMSRLVYELDIINQLGYCDYFLIVKDIVEYCKGNGIPCVGRGSAADSIVSYVLDITKVDPVKYDLYFERFLNPERKEPPDIDLDLCWRRRDDVLNYIYKKYGQNKTAMICTFNTFKIRSAIADVAKTYGIPEKEVRSLTKSLPHQSLNKLDKVLNTIPECKNHPISRKIYREILRISKFIGDFPRHLSVHLGGVVIAPDEITDYTPLEKSGKGLIISQFDMHSIEKIGIIKIDLLGVRMLSAINDCLKYTDMKNVDFIPENDEETFKMLMDGKTVGCFQLESPIMRTLLKKMKVKNINDIIAAISVIRPGPAEGGMKDLYVKRRCGLEKVNYLHPSLEPVLKETYGVILYQEQVLKIANVIAGFTLAEADLLRRAMTKSRNLKTMLIMKSKFVKGAMERGIKRNTAQRIWKMIENFVGYGFNKAHSATYGMISYYSAYLKRHYPSAYMTAVLNNGGGFYTIAEYIEECRRLGINILPPDVNISEREFTFKDNTIISGFFPVYELTSKTIERILENRKKSNFKDIFDFLYRVNPSEREAVNLAKCGALNNLEENEAKALAKIQIFFRNKKKKEPAIYFTRNIDFPSYSIEQKVINELQILRYAISAHPLSLFPEIESDLSITSSSELEKKKGQLVKVAGWLVTMRRAPSKNGGYVKFITIEDKEGLMECIMFPDVYKRYGKILQGYGPYIVKGKVQSRVQGEANIIVDKLYKLEKTVIPELRLDKIPESYGFLSS